MFKHILLPLDGSALAESVLPAAEYLARVFGAKITLVHIIEKDGQAMVHGERHLTQPAEAEAYLAQIRQRAFAPETAVSLHVHESAVQDVAHSGVPVIGSGGVYTSKDAAAMQAAGAVAIQLDAVLWRGGWN